MIQATPQQIAELITKNTGQKVTVSGNTLKVYVTGNRLEAMEKLSVMLKNLDAKIDTNMKGSSIGGISIGKIKIFIKTEGKSNGLDVESRAIDLLNDQIAIAVTDYGSPITIKIAREDVKGCFQVVKTPGTPKSDFYIADESGKQLIHISHKKGSKPTDFQQWGGLAEKKIAENEEVRNFGLAAKAKFGNKMPNATTAWREIKKDNLKLMSIYGVNHGKRGDPNSVDVLIQGDPILEKVSNGVYKLNATGHITFYPTIPSGGFEPIIAIIYKGDRDQFGIKGARGSIYPKGGRNFKNSDKI